ncbi:MAG: ABC-ATPase domain-containing protein [Cyanobacteria bacterium P01_A01_bin.116]
MTDQQTLYQQLSNLEGHSFKRYKSIRGHYAFPEFVLWLDYVQGDPFAAPSRIRLTLKQEVTGFPSPWLTDYVAQVAIADYLTRQVAQVAQSLEKKRGSGKSGNIDISGPSQAILRRSAIWIDAGGLEARLTVGLPAIGRRIAGAAAAELLCEDIPQLVDRALKYSAVDADKLKQHIHTLQESEALRNQLSEKGLVAFIAKDAWLPRRSGVDDRPLIVDEQIVDEQIVDEQIVDEQIGDEQIVDEQISDVLRGNVLTNDDRTDIDLFTPPAEATVALAAPYSGQVKGLGIPAGVTLIVGGGYHGKSTLLKAIEQGIYNHIPGDGRQQVVADSRTVKLRAEDGRSVVGVDLSPVINNLPKNQPSHNFSTTNASGSTSQAAGLMEAIEAGAKVLLIDEDTAATNFMIRDRNMQALIAKNKEPITPLVDKVRQLYDDYGISTILVMGGSGDYFSVADTVIAMEEYQPRIVTRQAKAIAQSNAAPRQPEGPQHFGKPVSRAILPNSLPPQRGDKPLKIKARKDSLMLGYEEIDLRAIEQIVESQQVRAIALAIIYAQKYYFDPQRPLSDVLDVVIADIKRGGLDALSEGIDGRRLGDLAEFRRFELAAAINRLRTVNAFPISI